MKPILNVTPNWQKISAFKALDDILSSAKVPFYLVGGAVRESILLSHCHPQGDIDLTTPLTPNQVLEKLKNHSIKIITQAQEFGTLKFVVDGHAFELTSFRQDIKTNGRHAEIDFTDDITLDAKRRDFTCNALYANKNGEVYDPTGHGLEDLLVGRVRFIGTPQHRIQEDHLRLLRLFRFQALLGKRPLPRSYLKLARKYGPTLKKLSAERRYEELIKTIKLPRGYAVLKRMYKLGLWPELFNMTKKPQTFPLFFSLRLSQKLPVMTLWALGARVGELPLTKEEKHRISLYSYWGHILQYQKSKKTLFEAVQYLSMPEFKGLCALCASSKHHYHRMVRFAQQYQDKVFPLTAKDVMQILKLKEGPKIGTLLKQARQYWINSLGTAQKEACLEVVKQSNLAS